MKYSLEQSAFAHFFFSSTRSAFLWLAVRLYLGYEWVMAGWEKFQNPAWIGDESGKAITGFLQHALAKTTGPHPDVQSWYAYFIEQVALNHTVLLSYLVTFGELAVGIALITGFLVGLSAFFGVFMNANFLLSGSVSINPNMIFFGILLILAWRVAGYYGLDRVVLPKLRTALRSYKSRQNAGIAVQ